MNTFTKPLTQRIATSQPKFNANRRVIHTLGSKNPIVLNPINR